MNTKGRYVAFAGEDYERNGGFLDFFASHDNLQELSAKVQTFGKEDDDQLPVNGQCQRESLSTTTETYHVRRLSLRRQRLQQPGL